MSCRIQIWAAEAGPSPRKERQTCFAVLFASGLNAIPTILLSQTSSVQSRIRPERPCRRVLREPDSRIVVHGFGRGEQDDCGCAARGLRPADQFVAGALLLV